jgi:hypothetical protein
VRFQTKPEIALELIRQTLSEGVVTPAPVLGDSVYGDNPAFRAGLRALGLEYALHVGGRQLTWRVPPPDRHHDTPPETLKDVAYALGPASWRTAHWKDTQGRPHQTRLAWMPVWLKTESGTDVPAQWLIVDWPEQLDQPHHLILAHLNKPPNKARALALSRSRWPSGSRMNLDSITWKPGAGAPFITTWPSPPWLTVSSSPNASALKKTSLSALTWEQTLHAIRIWLLRQLDCCPYCQRDNPDPSPWSG